MNPKKWTSKTALLVTFLFAIYIVSCTGGGDSGESEEDSVQYKLAVLQDFAAGNTDVTGDTGGEVENILDISVSLLTGGVFQTGGSVGQSGDAGVGQAFEEGVGQAASPGVGQALDLVSGTDGSTLPDVCIAGCEALVNSTAMTLDCIAEGVSSIVGLIDLNQCYQIIEVLIVEFSEADVTAGCKLASAAIGECGGKVGVVPGSGGSEGDPSAGDVGSTGDIASACATACADGCAGDQACYDLCYDACINQ